MLPSRRAALAACLLVLCWVVAAASAPPEVELVSGRLKIGSQPELKFSSAGGPVDAVGVVVNANDRVGLRFQLLANGKTVAPHQVFCRFVQVSDRKNPLDVYFLPEIDDDAFVFVLSMAKLGADVFKFRSGLYKAEVYVGDASAVKANAIPVGELQLSFGSKREIETDESVYDRVKPVKFHTFREPEKRPSRFFSGLVSALVLMPLLIFVAALLFVVRPSLGNLPTSPRDRLFAGLFSLGLLLILLLLVHYWVSLSFFTTAKLLFVLGVFTFYAGYRTLRVLPLSGHHSEKKDK